MWPFTRPKPPTLGLRDDVFWLSTLAKVHGLAALAKRSLASGTHVLLIAHAPDTLDRIGEAAAMAALPLESLSSPATAPELFARLQAHRDPALILAFASDLRPSPPRSATARPAGSAPIQVLIAERFPHRTHDDAIVAFAAALPAAGIEFHISAEDPLLAAFAGDRTKAVLRSLGMADHDSITHPMLGRSIERAQQKILKQCPDPTMVESWLLARAKK